MSLAPKQNQVESKAFVASEETKPFRGQETQQLRSDKPEMLEKVRAKYVKLHLHISNS